MNPRNLEDLVLDVESKNRIGRSIPFFFLIWEKTSIPQISKYIRPILLINPLTIINL